MNTTRKPQRAFLAVTLMTVLALTAVFMVYAALLATFTGSTVTVTQPGGSIEYNKYGTSNATWQSTLDIVIGTAWYARLNITNSGAQAVTIKWILLKNDVYNANPRNSTITLATGSNTLYATDNGKCVGNATSNYDWGQLTTAEDIYKVKAEIYG